MADLGNLNFGVHLKDYTEQEYEAIKKKLVNMHVTTSAKVGLKVDIKEIEDKVEALLKNKTYKVKLDVDSESIKKLKEAFKGHGVDASELRAMRGVSQIIRADAYVNSQKALEQLRIARMQAAKASDTHNAAMKRTNTTMSSQSRIAGELKNQIANVYSIYTLERFVRGLYTIGGEFQKQRIALTSILGDSMKAETIFNRIKDLAVVSPFQFKELASYTKQLSAYSIPYEELYDTTKRLADISAGVGVDMGRIILAYGQVRSAAFLRGQELRQFTEAGIPLVDELAKRFTKLTGVVTSAGDVFDKISRKEVSFGMVKDVLWELTDEGGKFYNMQEALAESLAGKWSNLQDAWDVMMADIAEGNSGVLSDSLELLTDLMKHWKYFAKVIIPIIASFGTYKTMALLASSVNLKLIKTFISLTASVRSLKDAIALLGLVTKANPLGLLLGALSGIVALFYAFREEAKTTTEVITDLNKTIADTNDKMQGNKAVDSLIDRYETLSKKANKSTEESRELGRITKNLANTFKDAVTQTDKYGVAISLSVDKMRKLSQEQKDLYKKQFIGTMANAQIQKQSIDSEREKLASIIREGGYRRFDENGKELSFAKYKPEDITKARNRLLELEKQSLDLANIIDTARQSYHSMSQINISKPLADWEKEANRLAGDMDALKPKAGDSYEKYMEMLSGNISDLEKKTKAFASGNKYSEKQLASYNKELEVTRTIYKALGGLEKSSGNTKDPIAEQWKERTDLIDKAISSYDKWRKIEGDEAASQRVKSMPEFSFAFDGKGVNLDLNDPSKAYKYIQGQLDRSKEKQEDLYISLGIKIDKAGIDSAKKEVDDALKEIEKYVSQTGEKWDLYKKLFNASGNKSLSMNIAFGGEVSFKSVVDDLRNQLSKALENTGSKFSVTDVLAMKEDDVKKQFGEGVILKLYQSINEESKKMRSESLENLLGMIEDYKDYAQKIKDIERNLQKDLADIESQRGQLGEEATDRLIAQRKKKASEDAASTKFEQFKSSEDWAKTFDDLDRLSSATLSRLIKNLEEFKNTTGQSLKVNEFKELVNVLKKLRDESESRNPFKTLSDGIKEYAEATEKLKKAQKELGFIQDGGEVTTGVSETSHTGTKKTDGGLSYQAKVVDKLTPKLKTLADAEKEVTDAQDEQNEASDKVQVGFGDIVDMANLLIGTLGDLGSAFDALGNDSMGDTLSTVQEVAGGLLNTAQSGATLFAGISSGNPMAIMQGATGVVSGITGIIGSIAKAHDKKLDKAIQRSQLEVKKLSNDYKNLQSVIERQLGAVTQSQSKEMIANLQKQQEEVQKQMEAEQDKKDSDASKIEDYKQQYIELGEQIKYFYEDLASEQFGIDLKGWSDQISEALVNAFANGEDAAKAFDDTVADIMRNVIKEMISLNVIKPAMNKLRDYLFGDKGIFTDSSAGGTNLTEQEAAGLMQQLGSLRGTISDSKKIWDYLNAAAKKMGISLEETSASNTLSKGIQENITEETANILASYINGIRADVSVKRALLEKWGNEILPKYNVIAEQQLTQLRAIANNTLRSAQNTEANVALVQEVRDMLSIVIDRSGRKIKI
ncbi:hypothetical protein DWX40_03375 [Bacteroides stercoris]|jgi:hypothetical protein|uniref:tape measure protein n=1 Tax=Bacteroides stercoris TaxID=46506 RepID=UPI000E48A8FD|nr:tape measure protein [Bacteroides stercoris]RGT31644.1 hypothetical protein DWX40_03375 [Bacteroides stercoris]